MAVDCGTRSHDAAWWLPCLAAIAVAGCGGGGGGDAPPSPPPSTWTAGSFLPSASFANRCAAPRSGIDPDTGLPYPDVLGSTTTENNWLRSWSHELYLWYDEIVDRDPSLYTTLDYFERMKTTATTPSGRPKDRFHYTYPTAEWRALSQSGVAVSYGIEWAVAAYDPPRDIRVAYTEPNSPAANVARGDRVIAIDGIDVVYTYNPASIEAFVNALYADEPNETHTFRFQGQGTSTEYDVSLTATAVTATPVRNVAVHQTLTGPVGYVLFNDHLATAEHALYLAFQTLDNTNVTDLVLDLRYNGGGYLAIASQLAYMIAGTVPTAGQTFEALQFNAKHTINPVTGGPLTPMPFIDETIGLSPSVAVGLPLPTLDLPRVYVLTGESTCSASESIINGLRGVGVEVIQIGSTTCGKPYGFYPEDNCGTTYFSIQFRGVNAAGFGDYGDGFTPQNSGAAGTKLPGCSVADDFSHALGDPLEGRFAAALEHRMSGTCPAPTGLAKPPARLSSTLPDDDAAPTLRLKSPLRENRILLP